MDIDIARWILEFLLRQPIEDCVVNSLLSVLPLSNNDTRLKKTILLRRISSEISIGSVSEKILESLEMIEELNYSEGTAVLDSMKAAYCAVAVDCTVKFLRENSDMCGGYIDAVKRIWRKRILELEIWENSGLVSDRLKDSKEEIEAAVWSSSVCKNFLMRNTRNDALNLVRAFVTEAKEHMGPPFLELAAQTMNGAGRKVQDLDNVSVANQSGEGAAVLPDAREDLNVKNRVGLGDTCNDMAGGSQMNISEEQMLRSSSAMENPVINQSRPSTEGDVNGLFKEIPCVAKDRGISDTKYDCVLTPEVKKLQEALKSSTLDLQAVVKDPLPEALHVATNVLSEIEREKSPEATSDKVDVHAPNPSNDNAVQAVQANKSIIGNQCSRHQNDMSRPSLMERNSTARTFEWGDDSIEASSGSPEQSKKLHLPSPKKKDCFSFETA